MGKSPVIGIIDDDDVERVVMDTFIAAAGYGTEVYASAEEFVDGMARTAARCLVVDVQLGGISGIELGRHVAALGLKLPIIFVTGTDDQTLRQQGLELGCVAYLQKPLDSRLLLDGIELAVGRPKP